MKLLVVLAACLAFALSEEFETNSYDNYDYNKGYSVTQQNYPAPDNNYASPTTSQENWQNPTGVANDWQNPSNTWENPTNGWQNQQNPVNENNWGIQYDPPQQTWTPPKNPPQTSPTQQAPSKPPQNQNQQPWNPPAKPPQNQNQPWNPPAKPPQNQNQPWNPPAKPPQNQNQQTWAPTPKPPQNQNQNNWNQNQNNWNQNQNNWNQNQNWNQPIVPTTHPAVIKNEQTFGQNGNYKYEYQIADGTHVGEEGFVVYPNTENETIVKKGWYSYPGADGKIYTVTYWADNSGFHAYGDHLPKPPPASPAIQTAIDADKNKPSQGNYPQQQPQKPTRPQKPQTPVQKPPQQTYYPQQQQPQQTYYPQKPVASQPTQQTYPQQTQPSYNQQTYYPGK